MKNTDLIKDQNIFAKNLEDFISSISFLSENKNYFKEKTAKIFPEVKGNNYIFGKISLYYSFDLKDFVFEPIPGDTSFVLSIDLDNIKSKRLENYLKSEFLDSKNKDTLLSQGLIIPIKFFSLAIVKILLYQKEDLCEKIITDVLEDKSENVYLLYKGTFTEKYYNYERLGDSYFNPSNERYYSRIVKNIFEGKQSIKLFNTKKSNLNDFFWSNIDFIVSQGYFYKSDLKEVLLYCLKNNLNEISEELILNLLSHSKLIDNYKKYIIILTYMFNSFLKVRPKAIKEVINIFDNSETKEEKIFVFNTQFLFQRKINNQFIIENNIKKSIKDKDELYYSLFLSSYYKMEQLFLKKKIDTQFDIEKPYNINSVFFDYPNSHNSIIHKDFLDLTRGYFEEDGDESKDYLFVAQSYSLLKLIGNLNDLELNKKLLDTRYLFSSYKILYSDKLHLSSELSELFYETLPIINYGNLCVEMDPYLNTEVIIKILNNNFFDNFLIIDLFDQVIYTLNNPDLYNSIDYSSINSLILKILSNINSGEMTIDRLKKLILPGIYPGGNGFEKLLKEKIDVNDFLDKEFKAIEEKFGVVLKSDSKKYYVKNLDIFIEINKNILSLINLLENNNKK